MKKSFILVQGINKLHYTILPAQKLEQLMLLSLNSASNSKY